MGSYNTPNDHGGTVPMEIGNVSTGASQDLSGQRRTDLARGSCFKCHKVGCRPWKCRHRINNTNAASHMETQKDGTVLLSDSENE